MQRQQISSDVNSQQKHSQHSRSVRRLYNRINHNIRVLNKSRVSNRSNNSIGSVALRRTELSNDKIYSREEDFGQSNNSSQFGVQIDSGLGMNSKQSGGLASVQSAGKYRQRNKESRQQSLSRRSDSQKSYKYRVVNKKMTNQQIQKLYMMDDRGDNQMQRRQEKRYMDGGNEKYQSRREKQFMNDSQQRRNNRNGLSPYQRKGGSKLRPYKEQNMSRKSVIKPVKNIDRDKNIISDHKVKQPQFNGAYELDKLARKYNRHQGNKQVKQNKDKMGDEHFRLLQYERSGKRKEYNNEYYENKQRQKARQKQQQSQRKIMRYKSEKYISTNQSQIYSRKEGHKKLTYNQQPNVYQQEYQKRKYQQKNTYNENYKAQNLRPENSLERYQREQWTREKKYHKNKQIDRIKSEKLLFMEMSDKQYGRDKYRVKQTGGKSSMLLLASRHGESAMKRNIKIREGEYDNLYARVEDNSRVQKSQRSSKHKQASSRKYLYPSGNNRHQPQNEYYAYMTPSSLNSNYHGSNKASPTTQISSTFDSLILSIHSHVSASNNRNSVSKLIEKVELHVKTLEIIGDYAGEFRKMYEEVEEWEELMFLAYKKYWVERVKVTDYMKRFMSQQKRHSSQKIKLKSPSSGKLTLSSPIDEDPFSNGNSAQNPFTIPFCRLSQEQVIQICQSSEGSSLFQRLQQQTTSVYRRLQQQYNRVITKCSNQHINLLYCDNFSDEIYLQMLTQIQKLLPNLEEFKHFEVTKIRLGKIVKTGILLIHLNGKYVKNISEIVMFDDCEKIGEKKKIKTFTVYDLYYELFEKLVVE